MVHTGGAYPQQFGAATPSSLGLVRPAVWGCCFEMCTSTRHELFQQPDLKNRQTCFFSVFFCASPPPIAPCSVGRVAVSTHYDEEIKMTHGK